MLIWKFKGHEVDVENILLEISIVVAGVVIQAYNVRLEPSDSQYHAMHLENATTRPLR